MIIVLFFIGLEIDFINKFKNIGIKGQQMSKQKLAELVLQKMEQKRLEEERNRPHREVLQLFVKFEVEDYQQLHKDISDLEKSINVQQSIMQTIEKCNLQLENTGKKNYPRIIINPDFIASEHIQPLVKEYYRKSANTFLREDILKRQQFTVDEERMNLIKGFFSSLKSKEIQIQQIAEKNRVTTNNKRARNLKQDLRLRAIREEQRQLQLEIDRQKEQNQALLTEYEIKKTNLQSRINWSEQLVIKIQKQKELIEKVYNPVAYRDYLKTVFGIRTRNEFMQKNLMEAVKKVKDTEKKTYNRERFLEDKFRFFIQGKCTDSPSKKKRGNSDKNYFSTSPSKKSERPSKPKVATTARTDRVFTEKIATPRQSLNSSRKQNKFLSSTHGKTSASSTNLLRDSSVKKKDFNIPEDSALRKKLSQMN